MSIYLTHILEHAKHPTHFGNLESATHTCKKNNPLCGDNIEVFLEVGNNTIQKISFQGQGCAISQAAMSMLADELEGKSIEYAQNFSKEDIVDMLGIELSPTRLKCAILGRDSIIDALKN